MLYFKVHGREREREGGGRCAFPNRFLALHIFEENPSQAVAGESRNTTDETD